MGPEEAPVLAEELTQQRVWKSGQVTDGANPDTFQPDRRGRPAAGKPPQWQWGEESRLRAGWDHYEASWLA